MLIFLSNLLGITKGAPSQFDPAKLKTVKIRNRQMQYFNQARLDTKQNNVPYTRC